MSGRYRDLVDIQQNSSTPDNPSDDFSGDALYEDVPCDITAVSGGERYRGRQMEPDINYVVEMHYMAGIVSTMRLSVTGGIHSGKTLNIVSAKRVDYSGRPPKWELDCTD